jgi:hypothetical protein
MPGVWKMLKMIVAALMVAILLPAFVCAQDKARPSRVGYLGVDAPPPHHSGFFDAFREGMRELGYVEGQNISIESRMSSERIQLAPPSSRVRTIAISCIIGEGTVVVTPGVAPIDQPDSNTDRPSAVSFRGSVGPPVPRHLR